MVEVMIHKDNEIQYADDLNLISTTTPDSTVTYANDSFCKIAGYSQEELLSNHHNIVRHSDMPKAAFAQMWDAIQSNKSWMGLVKNARKGGGFYWVSAFITPITGLNGKIIEFQSVRSKPERKWVKRAENIYGRLSKEGR